MCVRECECECVDVRVGGWGQRGKWAASGTSVGGLLRSGNHPKSRVATIVYVAQRAICRQLTRIIPRAKEVSAAPAAAAGRGAA